MDTDVRLALRARSGRSFLAGPGPMAAAALHLWASLPYDAERKLCAVDATLLVMPLLLFARLTVALPAVAPDGSSEQA